MLRRSFLQAGIGAVAARAAEIAMEDRAGEEVRFLAGPRLLFAYRYTTAKPKPYIHPLCAPDGTVVTRDGPEDHVHHRGLMLAWSGVDGIDFWGETNPARHGRIEHVKFEARAKQGVRALNHWRAEGRLLVIETRTITAPQDAKDATVLDWDSVLTAPAGVRLGTAGHEYNGLGVRFAESMDLGEVLNSRGTAAIETANGENASWCAYQGRTEKGRAGVAIFDHPANPRHPTPFFVMNRPFGYMSAAPSFREDFELGKGESLRFRWRVVVWNGARGREAIDRMYRAWCGSPP